jgi:hypothetical protein
MSSKLIVHVEEARMPSFCSFLAIWIPMSLVAMKQVIPLYPLLGSISLGEYEYLHVDDVQVTALTWAKIRKMSASYEFVIHIFDPLRIQ